MFDRGFLFADGVYEVSAVLHGKLVDNAAHLARLERSLGELQMRSPVSMAELTDIQRQIIARNQLEEGVRLSADQPRRSRSRLRLSE